MFCGGLRQAGEKIRISVGAAIAVLEGVAERGEELEPPLNAHVMVYYFADALKCFVVRKIAKLRAPQVTSEPFIGPDDAASFQVQRGPVLLEIKGSPADTSNGLYRAVLLFLFVRGTKTVDAGVTVHVEGAAAVGYSAPVREDKNLRGSEPGEVLANDNFHGRRKDVLVDRSGRNLRQYPTPPISARTCLSFLGMGIFIKDVFPLLGVYPRTKWNDPDILRPWRLGETSRGRV